MDWPGRYGRKSGTRSPTGAQFTRSISRHDTQFHGLPKGSLEHWRERLERQLPFPWRTTNKAKACSSMSLFVVWRETGKERRVQVGGGPRPPAGCTPERAKSAVVAMHLLTSSLCFAAHACACCMRVWPVPAVYTCRMYAHTEYKRSHVRGVQTLPTSSNHLLVQFYRGRLNLLERISYRNAPFELIENETKREETIFFRSSKIYIFVFVEINRDARIPDVKGWIAIPCSSDN